MATPETLMMWLRDQAVPLAILVMLVIAAYLILKTSSSRRTASLVREREGVTEATFVEHLEQFHFDPVITGATYRYLQQVQNVSFPILPSDALDEDLGLDSDDVEQTLRELLRSLNRMDAPGLRHEPTITVEDLVRHLQASPRAAQSIAA